MPLLFVQTTRFMPMTTHWPSENLEFWGVSGEGACAASSFSGRWCFTGVMMRCRRN